MGGLNEAGEVLGTAGDIPDLAQPGDQLVDARRRMRNAQLANPCSRRIQHHHVVMLIRPIDARKPHLHGTTPLALTYRRGPLLSAVAFYQHSRCILLWSIPQEVASRKTTLDGAIASWPSPILSAVPPQASRLLTAGSL